MMNTAEILAYINEIAPAGYAEDWDNVGLLVGSRKRMISKVLICLDVTSGVIDEAIEQGADLIISHHPFLFSKLSRMDLDTQKGKQIETLIKNDICVISVHTNLDFTSGGVNDTLAEALSLTECGNLKTYSPEGFNCVLGMGKVGELQSEESAENFIRNLKQALSVDNVRLIGNQPNTVKKVAVFCGSFDGDLQSVYSQNVDVLVTGDIKYHTALDAQEINLFVIDVGHFASEYLIVNKLKALLSKKFDGVEFICSNMEKDPFIFA